MGLVAKTVVLCVALSCLASCSTDAYSIPTNATRVEVRVAVDDRGVKEAFKSVCHYWVSVDAASGRYTVLCEEDDRVRFTTSTEDSVALFMGQHATMVANDVYEKLY